MKNPVHKKLLAACQRELDAKIALLQSEFNLYKEAVSDETKSTAGDKHDTARSMMQMEQEKMSHQLQGLLEQKKILDSIDRNYHKNTNGLGSIIYSNQGNFFISVFSKPVVLGKETFLPVSLQSPIGKLLINCKAGQEITFNKKKYKILSVK